MKYESVIGLEVHVELKTKTKIFCGCSTEFGAEPNTHVCPVCLGLPGVLPVLNKEVLHYAVKAGLALHCDILPFSKFDRKNYYYPDLPKNFQTSQFDLPICKGGYIDIDVDGKQRRIHLTRIHMEEDAGKLVHSGSTIATSDSSRVDYNRTGVPLLEIVGEPELRSGAEARAYLEKLRSIMQYLGVSDCRLEEGSMRCDANISIRPVGSTTLGTKTEIKNINSFSAVQKGIEYEAVRQAQILEEGGTIQQATRGWDEAKGVTILQRVKEGDSDYRYFPEPDLIPIEVSPAYIEEVRKELPEMPDARCQRFQDELGLSEYDANLLTLEKQTADYFETVVKEGVDAKEAANWMLGEFAKKLNEEGIGITDSPVAPTALLAGISSAPSPAAAYKIEAPKVSPLRSASLAADPMGWGMTTASWCCSLKALAAAFISSISASVSTGTTSSKVTASRSQRFSIRAVKSAALAPFSPRMTMIGTQPRSTACPAMSSRLSSSRLPSILTASMRDERMAKRRMDP